MKIKKLLKCSAKRYTPFNFSSVKPTVDYSCGELNMDHQKSHFWLSVGWTELGFYDDILVRIGFITGLDFKTGKSMIDLPITEKIPVFDLELLKYDEGELQYIRDVDFGFYDSIYDPDARQLTVLLGTPIHGFRYNDFLVLIDSSEAFAGFVINVPEFVHERLFIVDPLKKEKEISQNRLIFMEKIDDGSIFEEIKHRLTEKGLSEPFIWFTDANYYRFWRYDFVFTGLDVLQLAEPLRNSIVEGKLVIFLTRKDGNVILAPARCFRRVSYLDDDLLNDELLQISEWRMSYLENFIVIKHDSFLGRIAKMIFPYLKSLINRFRNLMQRVLN